MAMPPADAFFVITLALIVARLVDHAFLTTASWLAMRRMPTISAAELAQLGMPPVQTPDEPSRDQDAFVDGWRACEGCKAITPELDTEHILHHFTWNHDGRWPLCRRPTAPRSQVNVSGDGPGSA
jgi:hypothetical protein